jgi:hypothetical protein
MKGKIAQIARRQVTMKDGTTKTVTEFTLEGDTGKYSCWAGMDGKNQGDEVEIEPQGPPNDYGVTKVRLAGSKPGGFQPRGKSPEEVKLQAHSFALSYAKDITVACINMGILKTSQEIDGTVTHYNNLFKGILEA